MFSALARCRGKCLARDTAGSGNNKKARFNHRHVYAGLLRCAAAAPVAPQSCRSGRAALLRVRAQAAATPSKVKMVIQGRKLQVTEPIRSYVESKISRALGNFGQEVKEVDVTLSARGGDTGTHGKKCVLSRGRVLATTSPHPCSAYR